MKKFWCLFFLFWPTLAVVLCWIAPSQGWWFPSDAKTPLGVRIDSLFSLILLITTVVFIGTHIALFWVLWKGSTTEKEDVVYTHGSHNLEVIWTIVPAAILLFIALYQMDVWKEYRVISSFPEEARRRPIAEVTARQFEWRIRYPAPSRQFADQAAIDEWLRNPAEDDLHTVNDFHVPMGQNVMFYLRSDDVQHSFFAPQLRVKQDAVPGKVIPIWFLVTETGTFDLVCAELCGWGHYKMGARLVSESSENFQAYLSNLREEQFYDGVSEEAEETVAQSN